MHVFPKWLYFVFDEIDRLISLYLYTDQQRKTNKASWIDEGNNLIIMHFENCANKSKLNLKSHLKCYVEMVIIEIDSYGRRLRETNLSPMSMSL